MKSNDLMWQLFEGKTGELLKNLTNGWILPAPDSNPALLEMFRTRNQKPYRRLLPWSGEFAGKYLTGAVQVYRMTRDEALGEHIHQFVHTLLSFQAENGYLGPRADEYLLTGDAPNTSIYIHKPDDHPTWDAWEEYHVMLGLLKWYEVCRDEMVLSGVRRIGDLFCERFLNTGRRLADIGSTYANLAPVHSLGLLYLYTQEERYKRLALEIVKDLERPDCGDYFRLALADTEFYQNPQPRWESLHVVEGLAILYDITGNAMYKQAVEQIWWSIAKTDVHNTGGFSTSEQASGNPFGKGSIETCCTAAWMALSVDMLHLSKNSLVADALEISMYNGAWGSMHPSGRWFTYDTPMDGCRVPFFADYNWQTRPGSPEFNCCSATGAKMVGQLCEWATIKEADGLTVNYFGQGEIKTCTPCDKPLRVQQETAYPLDGTIRLTIHLQEPERFLLRIRIPSWSCKTTVKVGREPIINIQAGRYLELDKTWTDGDNVELDLDMEPWFSAGEYELKDKCCMYRGPILMAYDEAHNKTSIQERLPKLDAASLQEGEGETQSIYPPWMLFSYSSDEEETIQLCDFSSAGMSGSHYVTWFHVDHVIRREFTRDNLLRIAYIDRHREVAERAYAWSTKGGAGEF